MSSAEDLRGLGDSATPLESIDESLRLKGAIQQLKHRQAYAMGLLWILVAQLVFADITFCLYASSGMHWRLPDTVVIGFLAAVVIEVIGLVFVITRYLFPNRDGLDHSD